MSKENETYLIGLGDRISKLYDNGFLFDFGNNVYITNIPGIFFYHFAIIDLQTYSDQKFEETLNIIVEKIKKHKLNSFKIGKRISHKDYGEGKIIEDKEQLSKFYEVYVQFDKALPFLKSASEDRALSVSEYKDIVSLKDIELL